MRKRNFDYLFDGVFWYIIYILPVLAFLIYLFSKGEYSFAEFLTFNNMGFLTSNIFVESISEIVGQDGILPICNETQIIIVTWFVSSVILHLLVDFLLFVPRFCHKILDNLYA